MAPLDIVQAEAEVATREEAVILAEAAIERQQDIAARAGLQPVVAGLLDGAHRADRHRRRSCRRRSIPRPRSRTRWPAHRHRQHARKNLEINDVNIRYFRNQSLPDVNAIGQLQRLGHRRHAVRSAIGSGFPPATITRSDRSAACSAPLGDAFAGDFPGWSVQLHIAYPIGKSTQEAQLARARLQQTQAQNAACRASSSQVTTQVRDARAQRADQRQARRRDAVVARARRARLEAEEKKFQAGMTQNFFVLQAQRDLIVARNNELLALVEYAKSVVNYAAVQQVAAAPVAA